MQRETNIIGKDMEKTHVMKQFKIIIFEIKLQSTGREFTMLGL
jgi:hypothetical protein